MRDAGAFLNEKELAKARSPEYSTIKDNKYFAKFVKNYNNKLVAAFEEVDKISINKLNTSTATMKQDVVSYMEQHSEIRKLMKDEALR